MKKEFEYIVKELEQLRNKDNINASLKNLNIVGNCRDDKVSPKDKDKEKINVVNNFTKNIKNVLNPNTKLFINQKLKKSFK